MKIYYYAGGKMRKHPRGGLGGHCGDALFLSFRANSPGCQRLATRRD